MELEDDEAAVAQPRRGRCEQPPVRAEAVAGRVHGAHRLAGELGVCRCLGGCAYALYRIWRNEHSYS